MRLGFNIAVADTLAMHHAECSGAAAYGPLVIHVGLPEIRDGHPVSLVSGLAKPHPCMIPNDGKIYVSEVRYPSGNLYKCFSPESNIVAEDGPIKTRMPKANASLPTRSARRRIRRFAGCCANTASNFATVEPTLPSNQEAEREQRRQAPVPEPGMKDAEFAFTPPDSYRSPDLCPIYQLCSTRSTRA